MNIKQLAGEKAASFIESGMVVGLGTGSTAFYFVEELGRLVQAGLEIQGVPTSLRTEEQASRLGIPLLPLKEVEQIDVVVDGADEFDPDFHLIKGGGGALYREKMVASLSKEMIVVAGENKAVATLGAFPLPV
ncbi:MAG: ribose 5-phosphate isomerase A, partial [Bacteroidota bacterium]